MVDHYMATTALIMVLKNYGRSIIIHNPYSPIYLVIPLQMLKVRLCRELVPN